MDRICHRTVLYWLNEMDKWLAPTLTIESALSRMRTETEGIMG